MQKITTFLWFNDQAGEAMKFYLSVFKHSREINVSHYGDAGPGPKGSVMSATFELEGQEFIALNGGPHYSFTPAISLFITCADQAEVDYYWEKLTAGGEPSRCGWLKDRFGLSWQVVPEALGRMLGSGDPARSRRVMEALLKMDKLDIAALERAYGA